MSSCIVVIIPRCRRISSLRILSHVAASTYVDVALSRALLHIVVIVSCRCALLSSDKADHCFLSKCLDEFTIRIGIRLLWLSRPMQTVNGEEIHSGRLQMTAANKASTEQLITERIIKKNSTTFMTGNIWDNCYPHIRLLPTHSHLASADFIRLLPVATSAHPLITHSRLCMSMYRELQWLPR